MRVSRRLFLAGIAAGSGAALLGGLGCSTSNPGHTPDIDPAQLDLLSASRAVRGRSLSPLDLTRACLERIDRLDKRLNSFITVTAERALAEASAADGEIAKGRWRGPLHGIPVALKDNIDTNGVRTTAASGVFAERVPGEDAEVVGRLKAAGAVILGKLNMHEFALGTTSAISHFGPVRNPWDVSRVAGGSSGGSGAAVAARFCFGAVGTDTGGSIRIPASCCGIVGLKPTYGVVSARGTVPVSGLFDHVGPMCRTVADTALMFRAMTDHPLAAEYNPEAPTPIKGLRVGVLRAPDSLCDAPVEQEVLEVVGAAVEVIRPMVTEVREVELPMPEQLGRLIDADLYAYHAPHLAAAPGRYDPRTRNLVEGGREMSEAEVARLRLELERHRASIGAAFGLVDLVVLPTLPGLPQSVEDAKEPFSLAACTFAFSLGGLPAISVPCGFSRSGLPIGLLIGGPLLSEPRLLALAQAYEGVTNWHQRAPTL